MALQKIEKKKQEDKNSGAEPVPDLAAVYKSCRIDLTQEVPHPKILLSIGTDSHNNHIPICTEGEFSCIVAPSKTKKSFFKSLLCASYMGGSSNLKAPHITGHRVEEDYIYDIDTEQGKYYARRTFKRTEIIVGAPYKNYEPIYTRNLTPVQRVQLIDWMFTKGPHAGKIKLAFIDGIADLLNDANNLVLSNEVASYLLKWTDELKIHICVVIHKTFGNDKATGHLGSSVTKKAETLIFIDPLTDKDGNIINFNTVKVRCGVSRGKMFDDFLMSIDINGLPYTHDQQAPVKAAPAKGKENPQQLEAFGKDAKKTNKSDSTDSKKPHDDVPF